MPFITEELWHDELFGQRDERDCCIVAPYPVSEEYDERQLHGFASLQQVVSEIRNTRNMKQISPKTALPLAIQHHSDVDYQRYGSCIQKMANISEISFVTEKQSGIRFLVGTDEFYVQLEDNIDVDAERERLQKELEYFQGFLKSVDAKLANERFVQNAKPEIVANERKKKADAEAKIHLLDEALKSLG